MKSDDKVFFPDYNSINIGDSDAFKNWYNSVRYEVLNSYKKETCIICRNSMESACHSHSLLQFILKNIASKGTLLPAYHFFGLSPDKNIKGVKNIFLFRNICKDCDNVSFKDYEDEKVLLGNLTNALINEISSKNNLRVLFKREIDFEIFKRAIKEISDKSGINKSNVFEILHWYQSNNTVLQLDIEGYTKRIKQILKNIHEKNHYVFFDIILEYKVKIAFQGSVALVRDFDGKIINNIYNHDSAYAIEDLNICIFPLENQSRIILFINDGAKRYKSFYKRSRKLTLSEQLYAINYLVLLYSEEWCIDASFDKNNLNKETLDIINHSDNAFVNTNNPSISEKEKEDLVINNLSDKFTPQIKGNIYNFLVNE